MASRAAKFVPVGMVAGALGYLCWPYLPTPVAPAPPKKLLDGSELTAAMLAPPPFTAIERDPFGMIVPDLNASGGDTASGPRIVRATKTTTTPRRSLSSNGNGSEPLVLHGTYLRGNHRVALINKAVYHEGDQITLDEETGTFCRIAEISIDKVVLDLNGEMAELSYPNFLAPPPPQNPQQQLPIEESLVPVATADDLPHEAD